MEETAKASMKDISIRYGIISAVAGIVLFLVPALMAQNPFKGIWNWLGIGVGLVILVLAHKKFKDDGDGFMSLGEGVGIGFWIGVISTIIGGGFTFVYLQFIDGSPFELMLEQNAEEMQAGGSPENAIEIAQTWTRNLFWPIYAFFGVIGSLFFAFIVSLFTRKTTPESPM